MTDETHEVCSKDLRPGDLVMWYNLTWYIVSIVRRRNKTLDICYLSIYNAPHAISTPGLYRHDFIIDTHPMNVLRSDVT